MKQHTSIAIQVNKISKQFLLENNDQYYTFRDTISEYPKRFFQKLKKKEKRKKFWALKDITFDLNKGETLGIIGSNGAGKSTLLKILSRIISPTKGTAVISGNVASMLEIGTGFHTELTGRENIYLNGAILGMKRSEINKKFNDIVNFSEIGRFLDTPVKKYSSGMQVRLAFSVASHLDPEILLIDEVMAVGDMAFQRKSLSKMHSIVKDENRTIVFVSHNMAAVEALCNKSILLKNGRVLAYGKSKDVITKYIRTYSAESTPLQNITARSGNKKIHITDFWFEDEKGNKIHRPRSGDSCSFVFSFISPSGRKQKNVDLGFAVATATQQNLFLNYLSYTNQTLDNCPTSGKLKFKFSKFPLAEGQYKLSIRVTVNDEEADYIPTATFFNVEEGDFYKTGILIGQKHSPTYVDGFWELSE